MTGATAGEGAAAPKPSAGKKDPNKDVPAYMRCPFAQQTDRKQAVYGKLLEDNIMCRVLKGTGESNDITYDPKFESQSCSRNLGRVRRFGDLVGRIDVAKSGTRAAASGSYPSHWRPTGIPNDAITRPASSSSGVAFHKQITRRQDVNGKLLENLAMTRFLFGASGSGPEYYEKAYDSMSAPLNVSHRPRFGRGHNDFKQNTGRLPMTRAGTRAAANGTFPSHWEPGMGYSDSMPKAKNVSNFGTALGRCELHLSGMRGAPPNRALAADFQGAPRPQSAMQMVRGGGDGGAKRAQSAQMPRPIPEGPKKHIMAHSWDKQLTREQWSSRPMRG